MWIVWFFIFLPVAALSQTMGPDRWNSVVPENAMGQSISMYFQPGGAQVTMICAGRGMRLTISGDRLGSAPSDPAELRANPRFLYINGRYYPSADPEETYGADWMARLSQPIPEQMTLLQAIAAGADITVAIAPGGDLGKAIAVGTIPGRQNDPGYAHVVADCGGGSPVQGRVETRPMLERAPVNGAWTLRDRGENYPVPVAMAYVIGEKGRPTGGTLGLYCDGENMPAAYIFGYAPSLKDQNITVTLDVGGQMFTAPAVPYGTDHLFRVSQTMTAAIGQGATIRFRDSAAQSRRVDTNGGAAALAHAYGRCGPAQDF